MYAWGYNGYGQLGNGTTNSQYFPRKVSSLDGIIDVAVEDNTIIALNENGNVFSSGYNKYGNLGNSSTQDRYKFENVKENSENILTNVKSIEAGNNYAIAIKEDGTAVTWGYNSYGQSSNGTTRNNLLPVDLKYGVDKDKIDKIICAAAGQGTTTIVREDGKVWTIGKNNYGQLGDSSTTNKTEFVCISKPILLFEDTPIRIKGIVQTK